MSEQSTSLFPFSIRIKLLIVISCCIALNLNTLNHRYALDDGIVIGKNMHVNSGIAGIGKIMTTDAMQGFLDFSNAKMPLEGGRYRPLSIVTFALETEFFGNAAGKEYQEARNEYMKVQATATQLAQVEAAAQKVRNLEKQVIAENLELAPVRHGFQIAWFTLSMVVLFLFLHRYLLPGQPDVAFIATLLFVFHPLHTEVIANLKSRDEIFSLLFIVLSCSYVFRYMETGKMKDLLWMVACTILAMLSKEYAVALPVICFAAIFITRKTAPGKILTSTWFMVMCAAVGVMLLVRYSLVIHKQKVSSVTDVLNDPFMYATMQQKIATKIAILDQYLRLLFWPAPLSSDYSYQHYPYLTFANWQVWLSLVTWGLLVYVTYRLWKARHFLAFPLVFFFVFFMLVNNLLFDIGATMGERLIYHSSLGFCIIIAWLMMHYTQQIKFKNTLLYALLALVLIPMAAKTITRNADWEDNFTLFTRDVKYVPNSALANGNAGAEYYNKGYATLPQASAATHSDSVIFLAYVDSALPHLSKAISIHQLYINSYLNRALCYLARNQTDSAIADWKTAATNFKGRHPTLIEHSRLVMQMGKDAGGRGDYAEAARRLRDASIIDRGNGEIWYDLGGAEYMQGNFYDAVYAFQQALMVNPNLQDARNGADASASYVALINKCRADSSNVVNWLELARVLEENHFSAQSRNIYQTVLSIDPGNAQARKALQKKP